MGLFWVKDSKVALDDSSSDEVVSLSDDVATIKNFTQPVKFNSPEPVLPHWNGFFQPALNN